MTGHLSLVCAADENDRSFLREQSFSAPMHISKPFNERNTLVVNVINPTAGLFAGDDVTCEVRVEHGARLLVTSPSAQRVHRANGGCAVLRQNFFVEQGAFLEVLPEIFIPQAGARYRQRTNIFVEAGGELIFFETLAPGRVAMGEVFAFERLEWATDVHWDRKHVVRERYSLSPANDSLAALRERGYYASCFAFGETFSTNADSLRAIETLHDADVWIGCSAVCGGFVVKILARDSVTLRRVWAAGRKILHQARGGAAPELRRS